MVTRYFKNWPANRKHLSSGCIREGKKFVFQKRPKAQKFWLDKSMVAEYKEEAWGKYSG